MSPIFVGLVPLSLDDCWDVAYYEDTQHDDGEQLPEEYIAWLKEGCDGEPA